MGKYIIASFIAIGCLGIAFWYKNPNKQSPPQSTYTAKPSPVDQPVSSTIIVEKTQLPPDIIEAIKQTTVKTQGIRLALSQSQSDDPLLTKLKQNFPQSQIEPIFVSSSSSLDEIKKSVNTLKAACPRCVVIARSDLSQVDDPQLQALHNQLTNRILTNLDVDTLKSRAEVTSPEVLAFAIEWAKASKTEKFTLKTQSPFLGLYQSGDKAIPSPSVSFMIGGDLMFDRKVAHDYAADGLWKVLEKLGERVFWGTDAGVANLEGALSEEHQEDNIASNNLTFVFNPEAVDALKYAHFNGVSLANNHAANGGKKGLETTPRLLKEANIQPIGGPYDDDIDTVGTFKGQGLTLYVIGVHTLSTTPDLKPLIQKLKSEPTARVIVFPHWGVEYQYKHHSTQTQAAHAWIDAGADAVIGAHPHVIQDSELYNNKPIIYSIGNLVFDQFFSKETQRGLLIAGEFTDEGLRLFALPTQLKQSKPELLKGEEKQFLINRLYEPFASLKQSSQTGDALIFKK